MSTGDFQQNAMVSYNSNVDSLNVGNCCIPYPKYYDYYHDWYPRVYERTHIIQEKSKVDIAFRIITKLMEDGFIKNISAKELIKLTNNIAESL